MSQPQRAPECADKHGLIEDVRLAMNTLMRLNSRQMEAVIAGDFEKLKALQEELLGAREWKDALIDSYHRHVKEHGC